MRLGFDIDDTIADAYNLMFNLAQKYDIEDLKKNGNINTGNVEDGFYIGKIHSWNEQEINDFFNKYYKFALNKVKPKIFSVDILKKLKNEGNEIIIISSRFNNADVENINEITIEWLDKYNIPYDKLYTEVKDKISIIEKENIDIMVDDDYYVCKKVAEINKKAFLMNLESNREKQTDERIKRVYSWIQLYKNIRNIES